VQEFILDDTEDGPLYPVLFFAEHAAGHTSGRAYSGARLVELLAAAGVRELRRLPWNLSNGAGIIAGIVP